MAIELNLTSNKTAAASTSGSNGRDNRPTAMVWLNIGVPSKNDAGEDIFVSLPVGIPLDTMEAKPLTGKNEDWRQLVQAKNSLMEMLQAAASDMEAGQEEIVSDLQVQIRRVDEATAPVKGNNPLMSTLSTLSFAKKAA